MATEAFLINPVRRRKLNPRGLPSSLLKEMIAKHGPKLGMKKAWEKYKGKKRNYWPDDEKGHRKAAILGWRRRKKRTSGYARPKGAEYPLWNPLGEEVILVGANPRRRKRYKRNFVANPRRRKRRRNVEELALFNPRRRRSVRHNPVTALDISRPQTLVKPVAFGIGSILAVKKVPSYVGLSSGIARHGVQLAVTLAGGYLIDRQLDDRPSAVAWTIVGLVTTVSEVISQYLLPGWLGDENEYETAGAYTGTIGAYPEEAISSNVGDMSAYPYESYSFEEVGSMPY